jgi:hypothetical protein
VRYQQTREQGGTRKTETGLKKVEMRKWRQKEARVGEEKDAWEKANKD